MRTIYLYIADVSRCPCNCTTCTDHNEQWKSWGKACVVDPADVEQHDIIAICIKAKHACPHDLIKVKLHGSTV